MASGSETSLLRNSHDGTEQVTTTIVAARDGDRGVIVLG